MGEIADAMLEGSLCMGCGAYMGDGVGYGQHCEGCKPGKVRVSPSSKRRSKPRRRKGGKKR